MTFSYFEAMDTANKTNDPITKRKSFSFRPVPAGQAIEEFHRGIRGRVIAAADDDYETARKVYNGMIDRHPRLIAYCADVADVIAAVKLGRENDLLTAVRCGGHNGGGLGVCEDGLVIDLSLMKGVRVDPETRTVRVGAGCTQGEVDHATHPFGLAVPAGIVSTTGIAGLALGGGTGYLTRKYGLTIDNLIAANVVLANGSFVSRHNIPTSGGHCAAEAAISAW
jgi:FAD/FMN-containing dehydrogenase